MAPRSRTIALLLICAGVCMAGARAQAQTVPTGLTVETLVPGLPSPVAFEFLPDGRVLYTEQFSARVRLFKEGTGVQATTVITVPNVVAGGERGLLGLAVDPRFPTFPYLYVFHDAPSPNHIRIARYTLSGGLDTNSGLPLTADPATRYDLLDAIPDAASNHNGGTLHFGPDSMLYASVGDDANFCAAQDPLGLRGIILRMNVRTLPPGPGAAFFAQLAPADNPFAASTDSSAKLVAAYGLRNPFRFQLDPETGVLSIADVGENLREELSLLRPPGAPPDLPGSGATGANFGWPFLEGTAVGAHAGQCGAQPPGMTLPVFDYDRTSQPDGASIISAGIYRARPGRPRNLPASYSGDLFASDYYTGNVYRLVASGGSWSIAPPVPGQPNATHWAHGFNEVSDWRVGPDGALWFCRQSVDFNPNTGSIGRIAGPTVTVPPPVPSAPSLSLRLLGCPAVGRATFLVEGASPGASLTVLDAGGRVVRRYAASEFGLTPEGLRVTWDGYDSQGRAVGPGVYLVQLESASRTTSARVPFLR